MPTSLILPHHKSKPSSIYEHVTVIFKSEAGKWLYFFLSDALSQEKTFYSEGSDEEEKTNKINVGKKYSLTYSPKDNVQDNLGIIESYKPQ